MLVILSISFRRAAIDRSAAHSHTNKRTGLGGMNILQRSSVSRPGSSLQIDNLTADHSVSRPDGLCQLVNHTQLDSIRRRRGEYLESQSQQPVAGQDRGRLAVNDVAGRLAAPQVIIIERRKVVVNQRISMNHLQSAARSKQRRFVPAEEATGFQV